jgi:DNA-binding transcriptional MocR family regulator
MHDEGSIQFWRDRFDRRQGPLYLAIADTIGRAIDAREVLAGDRLPPQRQLATLLDVDLTTVTRGYAEARRRGLVDATVGRGTFIRDTGIRDTGIRDTGIRDTGIRGAGWPPFPAGVSSPVDMSMNVPPQPHGLSLRDMVRDGLAALLRDADMATLMAYHLGSGSEWARGAGAEWLRPVLGEVDPWRTLVCTGAQCAITALLTLLARPGDTILTEPLTYQRLRAAAGHLGIRLSAVAADDDGMLPEALDDACRTLAPKAIYCIPTMHNPTTVTMPPARRQAVAEVVLRHRVALIEDDAYGRLPRRPVPAIATLVPELTYYLGTLSKCLSPGLRVAYVVVPGRPEATRLETAMRATSLMTTPLMVRLVTGWIGQGAAEALCDGIRHEITARQAIARELLPADGFAAHPEGPHVWLTLPARWHRMAFSAHVRGLGLAVAPSDAFAVAEPPPNAVRIALGAAESQAALRAALQSVKAALAAEAPPELVDIV